MDNEALRELQLAELKILQAIKQVCEKHNIRYFLGCGTLLGAVRHNGFIPWDDDVDLIMPYDDYYRFLDVAQKEMSPDYFIQNYQTDDNFYASFTKVRMNDTAMMHWNDTQYHIHHGIWVDIFPLTHISSQGELSFKKRVIKLVNCLQMDAYIHANRDTFRREFSPFAMKALDALYILPMRVRKALHRAAMRFLHSGRSGAYVSYIWNSLAKVYPSDYFEGPATMLPFEGDSFQVPPRYKEYLTAEYGDYMKLPPVEERKNHSIGILDLRKSYLSYMKHES